MELPGIPGDLRRQIVQWKVLSRWERSELGRQLRRLGLSYGEIMTLIPVPKGTLAGWCAGIALTDAQQEQIFQRTGSLKGIPRDTQRQRRNEIADIEREARQYAGRHLSDALWVAGTTMYWGEGNKTGRRLGLSNADPRALRLFIEWTRQHHDQTPEFVLKLNLHQGNDEAAAIRYWSKATMLPGATFHRTFMKREGTGHRKNHLKHGVCMIRMRRSTDAWIRTMAWIDVLAERWAADGC